MMLLSVSTFAQSIFERYGVKQYGNTHDQPFYHAEDIHQDSLNRLVFKYSSKFRDYDYIMEYDGAEFKKVKALGRGELLAIDTIHNVKWYRPDLFTAVAYRGDSIYYMINTNDHFKLNFHKVYQVGHILYALTNSGVIEYQWKDEDLTFIRSIPFSSAAGVVDDILVIRDTIFCKTDEGVMYKLYDNVKVQHEVQHTGKRKRFELPSGAIVRKDREENRILPTDSWIYKLLISLNNRPTIYFEDNKGRFWVYVTSGENQGINLYERNSMNGQKIDLGIPKNTQITDLYEDHEGSIWIGTKGEGLIQIYEKTIQVLGSDNGLISDIVSSIEQGEDGSIYLSQACNGVSIIRPDYSIDKLSDGGCAKTILTQSNGRLWLNTYGLQQYRNEDYIKHYLRKDGLHSRTIKSIFEDSKEDLWVGTRQAIHRFDGKQFIPYVDDSIGFFNRVFNIIELAQDSFLLAFTEGQIMTFYDGEYTLVPTETDNVSHIYQDSEDRVWVATEGDGLYRYIDGKVEPMQNRDLFSADISFLQEDGFGNIWSISEDNTIRCANKNKFWNNEDVDVKKYTAADGLPLIHNERRMQPAVELLSDGKIIFPNIHGAIVIDPEKSKRDKPEYLSTYTYQDSIYLDRSTITLPVGQKDILFSVTNISLHPENHFEYEYSFSQENWIPIVDFSTVNIRNVPYGDNLLYIRTRYFDEQWNISKINVIAPAPFYYRWWFLLGGLIVMTGLISKFVAWRTGIVKNQNKILEEKVSEQTMALQNEKSQLAESLGLQRKLTQELNLSQASKNRMYAQISHEFKSPLQAINSYLGSSNDHITVEDKSRISGNIKQLLTTSSEIMELSKAESGELRAKKDYYNINNIIRDQINLKSSLSNEKNMSLEFIAKEERVYIQCDISLMQKVIGNLLSNAIKFSSVGGRVVISSKKSDIFQHISVLDHGVGIPSDEIGNLTLAYFQASNNDEAGTGIGLSLVDRILILHDSRLEIKSNLGEGSEFSFTMTRPNISNKEIESEYLDIEDIDSQLSKFINPNKEVILAVDDSPDILHFLNRTLNKEYNVITTTSGILALKHLDVINPSLIISDVNMPIMTGLELLREIRSIPMYTSIPFLLLTGSISEETELTGIDSGADFVLQKPIEVNYLKSQIKQILNRQVILIDEAKKSFVHGLLPQQMLDDDREVMIQMEDFILNNLENSKLLSADIANALGVGEKTLRNKVKSITGYTVKEYLKNFRLEKAKLLLEQDYGTKGEVATAVGFSSLSYFSKSYKKYFVSKED